MHNMKLKYGFGIVVLLAVALASIPAARANNGDRSPELPLPLCESIQVPEGNKVSFHTYARGVQIYKWNGGTWDFVAPVATLFAEENFFGEVGTHYVGPKWESKSGSKVEARRVLGTGCSPDPTAIAWLLLKKYETTGPGIFNRVTYIQRVNTTGGVAPTAAGSIVGEVKEVPYTAEYYFYRAE
jgi:uncharacterized protein DUF3455